MDYLEAGYLGLFVVCFLSATILPLTSEGVLIAFLLSGGEPITAVLVATSGNVLGGSTNYFLGRIGEPKWLRKLGVKETRILRFENWVKRYGVWTALLSWMPIVGDPLTIALGFFRANWWWVFLLMLLGKFLRYLLLVLPWILD
jgi:membrane protein YqaA with SNARE-associated domain